MAWLKELVRVVNGLSAVAKEAVRRSETADFKLESLIKRSIVSVTDLAGLTKGTPRPLLDISSSSSRHLINTTSTSTSTSTTTAAAAAAAAAAAPSPGSVTQSASATTSTGDTNKESIVFFNSDSHQPHQNQVLSQSCATDVHNDPVVIKEAADAANQELSASVATTTAADVTTPPPSSSSSSSSTLVSKRQRKPRERRVPSTPFSRALGFAGLGAGLAWGTLQESAKRLVFGTPNSQEKQSALSPYLSEKNAERLALALCRMRGAALKLGQMLSIQDESLVPAPILAALDIVRQGADVMPRSQLNQVLDAELGSNWSSKLTCFDYEPMAAASIGQVHRAVTKDGLEVAMKIQYPGVANSIESDIENLKLLLKYTNLIPEKLYLDNAMKVAKEELARECNYELEAENQKRFRSFLSDAKGFYVPLVVEDLSSKRILTTELVPGIPIDKVALLDQQTRNYVGKKLLELTLMELFSFRFMQTDPNWSNFLYDEGTKSINLIDFGAARDYPKHFVDNYLRMVLACANLDREAVIEMSKRLGFLTGSESEIMIEAHAQAGFVVGLPFAKAEGYDFRSTNITQSISNLGATMLRHRLTPPPEEAYSLHRKLSGAFLACIKVGAVVPCRELLLQAYQRYNFCQDCDQLSTTGSV